MTKKFQTQGEIDELTEGERAVIEADEAEKAAAAKAAEDAEKAAAEEAKAKEEAEAAPKEAKPPEEKPKATEEAPKTEQPQPKAIVAPQVLAPFVPQVDPELAKRDFAAERAALKAKWESGDIEQAEYDEQRDAITSAQTELRIAQKQSAQFQAHAAQVQQLSFEQLSAQMMALPENADLADPTRNKLFQSLIDRIDSETGNTLDNVALLNEAYRQFRAVVPAVQASPPPPPVRNPDTSALPPRIASAPAAASTTIVHQDVGAYAAMPIEDTEAALSRMSSDQIEQLLLKTPGSASIVERQQAQQ